MADIKIRVEVIVCPDEALKNHAPDPTWPRYAGLKVLFDDGAAAPKEALTDINGLAVSLVLAPGLADYGVRLDLVGTAVAGWAVPAPLRVPAAQADQLQRITLVPPAARRLLPLLLRREEPGGKTTPLGGARVTLEAVAGAAWTQTFISSNDGNVYALVPDSPAGAAVTSVKLQFQGMRDLEPKYTGITFSIPNPNDLLVEKPAFVYVPTRPARAAFHGISVKPKIIDLSGNEVPLEGATVTVKQQGATSQTEEYSRKLEDKAQQEVRFPGLESGVYIVTVTPPLTFNGWPIKAEPKQVGPYYLRADEQLEAEVAPFGFELVNLLIGTPDDKQLDHEVQLVIFGPDGSAEVTARNGKFSTAAPSGFPLNIKLASGAPPTIGGVPLEMQPASQDVGSPPFVTKVNLQYRHAVIGRAVDEAGRPMPGAVIVLYDGRQEAAQAVAGDDGHFIAGVKKAGNYSIAIQTEGGQPVTQRLVSVHSTCQVGDVVFRRLASPERGALPPGGGGGTSGDGGGDGPGAVREAFTDLAAYPVLTEEVSTTGAPASAVGGGAGGAVGAGYAQVVDQAMRDVLGWRPTNDAAGFQAALTGAFQLREVEGHTEWNWQQRGYAVQADMGALTGAQASIYARAKGALEQILPLLTGITTLNPALFPPQDLEAIRSVVIAELNELVNELGLVGGPRIERVDELFTLLLGDSIGSSNMNPDVVQGQFGTMRDRFGLTVAYVDTVDEERIITNFRIVIEQVLALQASWNAIDRNLLSTVNANSSLGTVLIWLSRGLEAVCESVNDLTFAMDSVFVDAAQRQVIELRFGEDQPILLLSDLLDWVVRACKDEGPRMIQDSGKDGVTAFAPVVRRLLDLVRRTWHVTRPGATLPAGMRPVPDGLRTPRVSRAFQVLVSQLDEARRLSGLVQRDAVPVITSTNPPSLVDDSGEVPVNLSGLNFRSRATAFLAAADREDIPDVPARHVQVTPPGRAVARFRIPGQQLNLQWQVVLTNEDGTRTEPAFIRVQRQD